MKYWTELRTALTVARLGTVKAAAADLGVHRATVNRHIETLEAAFETPLFLRHARGYALTEAGGDLLEVAGRADEMFADLEGRSRGKAGTLSGKLIVTALAMAAPTVVPAIREFHRAHPEIEIEFLAGAQRARLEYGEAHVAIRAGPKPEEPDYVVRLHRTVRWGLYASKGYVAEHGVPDGLDFRGHRFVGPSGNAPFLPFDDWMAAHVARSAYALHTVDLNVIRVAVCAGLGLGFVDEQDAAMCGPLVEILPPTDEMSLSLWTVTHVDLHRTDKVQAFLKCLQAR
ncbi:MAG: LysR family transcriptional regulator [Pseudomonadota bacterium]